MPTATSSRSRTAYHEAGHAVLSAALHETPQHVSIRGKEGTLGRCAQSKCGRPTSLAQLYLAGFAAEHLATGRRPRSYDIETGLGILAHTDPALVETMDGVEACDGYGAIHELLRTGVQPIEEELRREIELLYEIVRESLRAVWPSVRALARALLACGEMDRDDIAEVIGHDDVQTPVLSVQDHHGLVARASRDSPATILGVAHSPRMIRTDSARE